MSDRVVYFDGVCNLCNSSVNFLMKYENGSRLKFSSLQSDHGAKLISEFPFLAEKDSIVYFDGRNAWVESDAALKLVAFLKWPFQFLRIFWIFPRPIRNWFYRWVARNRYKWFGKRAVCRLPSEEERSRFLS